jgi:hypothetical protein
MCSTYLSVFECRAFIAKLAVFFLSSIQEMYFEAKVNLRYGLRHGVPTERHFNRLGSQIK